MKQGTGSNRLSIAVGADAVTAVQGERTLAVSRASDAGAIPIAQAFAEIARTFDRISSIDVAVMPSLCEVRLVHLPPLRAAEAEAVIRRDAGKHFTVSNEARVIGVRMPSHRSAGSASAAPVMACAVSHRVMDDIAATAAQAGWTVRRVVPAHAAWLNAASAGASREASMRARAFVAVDNDTAHLVRIENGSPVELRRFAAAHTAAIVSALGENAGTVSVFGSDPSSGLSNTLSSRGWSVLPGGAAAVVAAKHADRADLVLLSDADLARRAIAQRTLANRLAAAAVVLMICAALVMQWGARRELDAIHNRRLAIRDRVAPLLSLRDSVDALDARTRQTDEIFASQSRWSRTLYEITMLLPTDAHLTRLNATGDTIVIEGEASRAGDALEAIGRAPTLRNVQMEGPVQRDLADGTTTTERFAIKATLATAKKTETKTKRHVASPVARNGVDSLEAGRLP